MATGKEKTINHIQGFKDEINTVSQKTASDFFNWFDESGGDAEENFLKGKREFWTQIMLPLHKYVLVPKEKVALEIGCGGGRLLAAAAAVFNKVIGIDIHNNLSLVSSELHTRSIENFELIQNDGKTIPLPDDTVDIVYSYIVLQHVEKIDIFNHYLEETHRVLKEKGFAILYYARVPRFSVNREYKILYLLDRFIGLFVGNRYYERTERVNVVNLLIGDKYATSQALKIGFKVKATGVSKKLDNANKFGGQHYLILQK